MDRSEKLTPPKVSRFPLWVWGTFFITGSLTALWMAHGAAYSVWLNAHPQHDDDFWARMFYLHVCGFCLATLFAVVSGRKGLSVAEARGAPAQQRTRAAMSGVHAESPRTVNDV
jgi:hypothetical protein